MLFWVVVIIVVIVLCSKKGGNEPQYSVPQTRENHGTNISASTYQAPKQAPPTTHKFHGSNEDCAYIFGSMVAALGASGFVQIGGNGTVLFSVRGFGENWDTYKYDLPKNVYDVVSAASALTREFVAGVCVMEYQPRGSIQCSLVSDERWKEDVNFCFDIFEREMKRGYSDTNKQIKPLTFNRKIDAYNQYAVLEVGR